MAQFTSKPLNIPVDADTLYHKFDDLSTLQTLMEKLPDEAKAKIGDVSFEKDAIIISTSQVGTIKFVVKERCEPSKIVFGTEQSPVPLTLTAHLTPNGQGSTEITAVTDVEIPAMLKPLIGGAMQKATDQFGQLIGQLGSQI